MMKHPAKVTQNIFRKMHATHFWGIQALVVLISCGLFINSCDSLSDFGGMNEDPTKANSVEPGMLFTTVQLDAAGTRFEMWRTHLLYGEATIQQLVPTFYSGGNNYTKITAWLTSFFDTAYAGNGDPNRAQVKNVEALLDLVRQQKEEGQQVANEMAIARIMRVFIYSRITDLYGDIPYSEAGQGAIDQNFAPVYDPQQDIYTDMFSELDEAVKQFDASQPSFGDHDLMYGGDIAQWKKFANSLRLRLALRLVKVDQATAKQQAVAALQAPGGVMSSNDDIAYIDQQSGPSAGPNGLNTNAISEAMTGGGDHEFVAQTLIEWLKQRNDPRLEIYAESDKPFLGFPSGYDATTVQNHPKYPGSLDGYSRVNTILIDLDDPTFFQNYAEVEFMQAETIVRGWTSGDAASHYNNGVKAAMTYLSLYDGTGKADISDADVSQYLANNPFKTSGTEAEKIDQINSQYWASVFLNGIEAWSNWRRSGYPDLEPALVDSNDPPPGNDTNGQFPRRMLYPEGTEGILNTKNYNAVIDRQGPNTMVTRVWWDVEK